MYIWTTGAFMKLPRIRGGIKHPIGDVTLSLKHVNIPRSASGLLSCPVERLHMAGVGMPTLDLGNHVDKLPLLDGQPPPAVNAVVAVLLLVGLYAIH